MEDEDIFSAENHGPQISRFLLLFPRVLDNWSSLQNFLELPCKDSTDSCKIVGGFKMSTLVGTYVGNSLTQLHQNV
jgi:hypothetical protein